MPPRATQVRYSTNVDSGYGGYYLVDAVTGVPVTADPDVAIAGALVVPGGLLTFQSERRAYEVSQVPNLDTKTTWKEKAAHPKGCCCYWCDNY